MDVYGIVFIIVGFLVFLCGVVVLIVRMKTISKIKWMKVDATVCDVNQWRERIGESNHYVYYDIPTYRYTVNGMEYEKAVRDRFQAGSISVGMQTKILVDEKDPSRVYAEGNDSGSLLAGVTLCVLGLAFVFYGIIG